MIKAVYPGSFDPITLGHLDIVRRAAPLFDTLTVLVSHSREKKYLFSDVERKLLIEECVQDLKNVSVDICEGLTVDYLKTTQSQVIVRGIRAVSDFDNELIMANMNKSLAPDLETVVIFANPRFNYVASRVIKEVAMHGGDLSAAVPKPVIEALNSKLKNI